MREEALPCPALAGPPLVTLRSDLQLPWLYPSPPWVDLLVTAGSGVDEDVGPVLPRPYVVSLRADPDPSGGSARHGVLHGGLEMLQQQAAAAFHIVAC